MHMVHYNSKYGTKERAEINRDGLAVVGILYKVCVTIIWLMITNCYVTSLTVLRIVLTSGYANLDQISRNWKIRFKI